ncbi:hypothetical protein LKO27_11505 [Tessaracoccus sp. OS52]|uniref:FGGY-family carbohydrate kinase n=1 Tax=Tessaracoccus sp. OS52 TaxID=2886691 RepID=UPI001D106485|nr:FGGY family carbohydrate kinase [Tessaracoccus sp. OS52]MCC2594031.1 hypothetical protein [Tessaracoccus sp. OS52]
MSLIGVDLGTSGVRAGAYSSDGQELVSSAVGVELRNSGQRVELDMDAVLAAVADSLRSVIASPVIKADPPQALSFSVLGEAVVPLDSSLQPLADAPVSMDPRGLAAAQAIRDTLGDERFQEITGQPLHPMFSIFKIAANLDGAWSGRKIRYATIDTWVASEMGAHFATDLSMAARTGAYDVENRSWSEEVLDGISRTSGVAVSSRQLPEAVESGTVIGVVSDRAADKFSLPIGLPIIAGAHDQAASWVGVGGEPGILSAFSLGSSDCLTFGHDGRPSQLIGTGLATYPLRAGQWVTLAGTAAGGWALEWFARLTGTPVPELFADLPNEPSSLMVLPYLAGSGTLDNDPAATGVIAGLTLGATRQDVALALVEAAGFELGKILRELQERGLRAGRIVATGGGASNHAALTARADAAGVGLTGYPGHASLRGAAMLAGIGIGVVDVVPPVTGQGTGEPRYPGWFSQRRTTYRDLYTATRPLSLQTFQQDPTQGEESS